MDFLKKQVGIDGVHVALGLVLVAAVVIWFVWFRK